MQVYSLFSCSILIRIIPNKYLLDHIILSIGKNFGNCFSELDYLPLILILRIVHLDIFKYLDDFIEKTFWFNAVEKFRKSLGELFMFVLQEDKA